MTSDTVYPGIREMDYCSRLRLLKIPTIAYRHARGDMIELYKYMHGVYRTGSNLLKFAKENKTRGHSFKLPTQVCVTRVRHDFFSQRVVCMWNNLPESVVASSSTNVFKKQLDAHWKSRMYELEIYYTHRDRPLV